MINELLYDAASSFLFFRLLPLILTVAVVALRTCRCSLRARPVVVVRHSPIGGWLGAFGCIDRGTVGGSGKEARRSSAFGRRGGCVLVGALHVDLLRVADGGSTERPRWPRSQATRSCWPGWSGRRS